MTLIARPPHGSMHQAVSTYMQMYIKKHGHANNPIFISPDLNGQGINLDMNGRYTFDTDQKVLIINILPYEIINHVTIDDLVDLTTMDILEPYRQYSESPMGFTRRVMEKMDFIHIVLKQPINKEGDQLDDIVIKSSIAGVELVPDNRFGFAAVSTTGCRCKLSNTIIQIPEPENNDAVANWEASLSHMINLGKNLGIDVITTLNQQLEKLKITQ